MTYKSDGVYFLNIDDVTIVNNVIDEYFYCDLEKCKGACCTMEDAFGAPLKYEELDIIQNVMTSIIRYLPQVCKDEIESNGFYEVIDGSYHTRTINGRECVFVYWDGDIAKCAIEKAYFKKEIKFRKPISCHLFPIRRNKFASDVLKANLIQICEPAFEKGVEMKVPIYEFCKESLIRCYGKNWYNALLKEIKKLKKD